METQAEDTAIVVDDLWLIPPSNSIQPNDVQWALGERIKELNCLYAMSRLAERHEADLDALLSDIVLVLPPSWQHPSYTEASIAFNGRSFATRDFQSTPWSQSAEIRVHGELAGEVIVVYTKPFPQAFDGPFLHEERVLLNTVAERIGTAAARMSAERQLRESNRLLNVEREALRETNIALRTVLARIEDEKLTVIDSIRANVQKILMPIVHGLMLATPEPQRQYIELLRENLEHITSPFVRKLATRYESLTPTEIRICNMIRSGMRTKEIAQVRNVSPATINRHREHIRHKLGIANEHVNLTTFLQSSMEGGNE